MGLSEAIIFCLKNYTNLNGRAGVLQFWFFMAFCFVISSLATIADILLYSQYPDGLGEFMPLNILVNLALLIPNISATSRRLHDTGHSAKWQFIGVTLIGLVPLIYWLCKRGDIGSNKYGTVSI